MDKKTKQHKIWLDESLLNRFKDACAPTDLKPGPMTEALIRAFTRAVETGGAGAIEWPIQIKQKQDTEIKYNAAREDELVGKVLEKLASYKIPPPEKIININEVESEDRDQKTGA